jgi:glycosyltransferase involved in cell wall biosynthesis
VVLHAGNIGEKQDMRVIMEAAEAMKKDGSVMFLLVGRGARRRYVEEYVKDHCLNNVLLLDVQPEEFLKEMFVSCDVALITQRKGAEDCVMPSKIFGPACAGRPVIISGDENSEIERLAREHDFGITIPAKDTAGLIAGICRLRDDRVLAERMGRNGRSFMVNHNHINIVLGRFEEGLRSMCGKIRIPADISCLSRKESGCTER